MTHRNVYMDCGCCVGDADHGACLDRAEHDATWRAYRDEYAAEVAAERDAGRPEHDVRAQLAASARQLADAARHLTGAERDAVLDAANRIREVADWAPAPAAGVLADALGTVGAGVVEHALRDGAAALGQDAEVDR